MSTKVTMITLPATVALLWATACSKPSYEPQPQPEPTPVEYHEFPIIAWAGIEVNQAKSKFGPMKEAGFNIYLDWFDTIEEVEKLLDAAEECDVKVITRSKNLLTDPEGEAGRLKNRKGLYGYFIMDEPSTSDLKVLGEIESRIQAVDKEHPCYINLYPNWAWGGTSTYLSRLSGYLSVVPAPFLSFDFYPILNREDGPGVYIRDGWYRNLEDIRKMSLAKKIPFWAFALSLAGGDSPHPTPVISDLRLQQFSNLLYGAQAFQYWTYWGIYHSGPTVVYNPVKQVNKELQVLARYFYGADIRNVWHTGGEIPEGTKELTSLPEGVKKLETGGPALVSDFESNGFTYLAVQNKDPRKNMSLDIEFNSKVTKFDREGMKATVEKAEMNLDPGDVVVFQIK